MIKELCVHSVTNEFEKLSDYTVNYSHSLESNKSISVQVIKTENNKKAYSLLENLNWLLYEGDYYNITNCTQKLKGEYLVKEMQGMIKWIWDLNGKRRREVLNGHIRPKAMLEFILQETGYKFELDETDLETSVEVENFGSDCVKDLLSSFKQKFEVEITCHNDTIYVAKHLGKRTEKILKEKFNISDVISNMDTTEIYTYIRGWGAYVEDEDEEEDAPIRYVVEGDYVSPLEAVYPRREAPWVDDRRISLKETLAEAMKREVNDSLNVSISLTAKQLEDMDISDLECGDWLWCLIDPFGIDHQLRVVEIRNTHDTSQSPVLTLGSIKRRITKRMGGFERAQATISKVIDPATNQIRPTAINVGNIPVNLSNAKGTLPAERISGLPSYELASSLTNGLMSSEHFTKVELINIDPNGNISIPLADAFSSGLMSSAQFTKLEGIQVDSNGHVVVDLTAIYSKIDALEQRIRNLEGGGTIG